jgi:hypothetical protein
VRHFNEGKIVNMYTKLTLKGWILRIRSLKSNNYKV